MRKFIENCVQFSVRLLAPELSRRQGHLTRQQHLDFAARFEPRPALDHTAARDSPPSSYQVTSGL